MNWLRLLVLLVSSIGFIACGDDDETPDAGSDTGTVDAEPETDAGEDDAGESDAGSDAEPETDAGADAGEADAGDDAGEADAGQDAGDPDAGRTIFEGPCARSFGSCTEDTDCMPSGCGSETCASEPIASTCDCTRPAASCGCIDGACVWYN